MDAAELWLLEHDPVYDVTSRAWKHITSGDYVGPWQEVPVGGAGEVDDALRKSRRVPLEGSHKLCQGCSEPFAPSRAGHVFCGSRCRLRAHRRVKRESV